MCFTSGCHAVLGGVATGAAKGLRTRDYIRMMKFDFRELLSKHLYVSKMNSDLPYLCPTSKWHCCW